MQKLSIAKNSWGILRFVSSRVPRLTLRTEAPRRSKNGEQLTGAHLKANGEHIIDKPNGEHVIDKHSKRTATTQVANGKIARVKVRHREKDDHSRRSRAARRWRSPTESRLSRLMRCIPAPS
jgi:hypothetical protein